MEKELIVLGTPEYFFDVAENYVLSEWLKTREGPRPYIGGGKGSLIDSPFGYWQTEDRGWIHIHALPDDKSLLKVWWEGDKAELDKLWATIEDEMKRQGFILSESVLQN